MVTYAGRSRARFRELNRTRVWERRRPAPPLKTLVDQGDTCLIAPEDVGAIDPFGWAEPFIEANQDGFDRLAVLSTIRAHRTRATVSLKSGDRLGAVSLLSPVNRKVSAGLLVSPRFGWSSVGQVLGEVGFRIEPDVGGGALVPGSAREVPPWVLAGPVVSRLAAAIQHLTRTFTRTIEDRPSPRGTVDWNAYARRSLPSGLWTSFRCAYSELSEDPELLSALRWTLRRVGQDLELASETLVARRLVERIGLLLLRLGLGPDRRPRPGELAPILATDWLRLALQAVEWVRDERGLGGARSLDGLPWMLPVSVLWEAWVESFLFEVARRLGGKLSTAREGSTARALVWQTATRSLGHLAPDFLLDLPGRGVLVDAKYKDHLERLTTGGWEKLTSDVQEAHRADLHQALAYGLLTDRPTVDSILVYPGPCDSTSAMRAAATLTAGDRQVRVLFLSLPFGFDSPALHSQTLTDWEQQLTRSAEP